MSIKITAIICTYNRAEYLRRSIKSLEIQTLDKDLYEVLVIDNGSTDNTKNVFEESSRKVPNIKYYYEPEHGLSNARNKGLSIASGEYVAFLDDDAIASPEWLEKILEAFETFKPRPGVIGGKIEPIWESVPPSWFTDTLLRSISIIHWSEKPAYINDYQWLAGTNIAYPKEIIESVGGFDITLGRVQNNLMSGEETLVNEKIRENGYGILYSPDIVVKHLVPGNRVNKRYLIYRHYWDGYSTAYVHCQTRYANSKIRKLKEIIKSFLQLTRLFLNILISFVKRDNDTVTFICLFTYRLSYILGLISLKRLKK